MRVACSVGARVYGNHLSWTLVFETKVSASENTRRSFAETSIAIGHDFKVLYNKLELT